jgi:putative ATP-binding cassette transporter
MKRYLIYMALLSIIEIALAFYLTEWRHTFWDFVEKRNYNGFLTQIGIFTGVALVLCFVASYAQYCGTLAAIKWREKLNTKTSSVARPSIENLNQRIQEDCKEYPDLMIQVLFGFGKALVYVIVFAISLAISFSWVYLTIILTYAILSTWIAKKISMPLISLNYQSQRAEATYRNGLSVRNFEDCIQIMLGLAKKTKHLSYFQTFYGQVAVILPIVIVAPAYFSAALTLGGLMQCTSIMSTISDNLSYGINSFNIINRLISCRKRLKEIGVI